MKKAEILLLLVASANVPLAIADDLAPGRWEITMETRVPSDAGWTPAPFNLTQCLSAGDAKDPSRLIGAVSTQGASGCGFTEKSYSGSTLRFAMECAGSFGLKTRGTVSFDANSFSGNITATANVGGQATELQNRIAGKRLGGC